MKVKYMQKIASYINGKITEYGKLDGFRRQPLDKQQHSAPVEYCR